MMPVAIFMAKIFAVVYLCVGLGALFNKKHFLRVIEEYSRNAGLNFMGGLIALTFGCLMVSFYNVWTADWTVLVTIIGWIAILKGVMYLVFPGTVEKMMANLHKSSLPAMIPWFCLIAAVVFGYFGFMTS